MLLPCTRSLTARCWREHNKPVCYQSLLLVPRKTIVGKFCLSWKKNNAEAAREEQRENGRNNVTNSRSFFFVPCVERIAPRSEIPRCLTSFLPFPLPAGLKRHGRSTSRSRSGPWAARYRGFFPSFGEHAGPGSPAGKRHLTCYRHRQADKGKEREKEKTTPDPNKTLRPETE